MTLLKKNETYTVDITGVTTEGNGVGKVDGFTIFIPDTTVGDVCEILVVKVNKSFGYGKLLKIITSSPDRIEVDCDVYNQCGGCCYRHISYEAELKLKFDMVDNAFKRIGGFSAETAAIIGSERVSGYRNKAQYPFGMNSDSIAICGFFAKRSHRVVSSSSCDLQPAFFSEIQSAVLSFIKEKKLSIYDELTKKGLFRHLYLRYAEKTNELMLCLVATDFSIPYCDELVSFITQKFPIIKSIVINKNSEDTNVILGKHCKIVFGSNTITDILCGVKIRLSPLSFYQVNRCQAELLYSKAIQYASLSKGDTLLDLYCGAGTIGLAAAGKVNRLIGVEIIPAAIENAKENARLNGISNAEFICADAGQAATQLAERGIRPDVIIVDPPRKGIDEVVVNAIIKMSPKKLVMVSCNPATAARDCKSLCERGYKLEAVTPVDMFPRTTHVETVCLLSKLKSDHHIEVNLNMDELDLTSAESKATYEEIKE